MQNVIDFYSPRRPTLQMVLRGENDERIVLHLCAPTTELVERCRASIPELERIANGDTQYSHAVYDTAADCINCNLSGFTTTGDELLEKYSMALDDLLIFFNAYVDFLTTISNAKN